MKRERVSLLAALSLDFGVIAILAMVLAYFTRSEDVGVWLIESRLTSIDSRAITVHVIDPGEGLEVIHVAAWLVGIVAGVGAIWHGHFSRWKAREFPKPPDGMERARWGFLLGYAWFVTLGVLTLPALPWELLVLLLFFWWGRIFVLQVSERRWLAMASMTAIAGAVILFSTLELRFAGLVGVTGLVILALMPGFAFFHPHLDTKQSIATLVILYIMTIVTLLLTWQPLGEEFRST